ncbi:TPA: hypothetical protein ACN341_004561 [Vibrio parahaemolyticus]|nr:hypothetical protein [Vibrio parahaemolyticus]EHR1263686.1 hypothetical protein [Vibrio parahaemolyticus]EJG1655750.1 hypothetical protein [Vibrio parahaemolyticus]EKB1982577.1 hypothetical protein [Vibrio parahaemolyticus]EME0849455.1 hypothetical protein [Vibrio parahaemolyticus]
MKLKYIKLFLWLERLTTRKSEPHWVTCFWNSSLLYWLTQFVILLLFTVNFAKGVRLTTLWLDSGSPFIEWFQLPTQLFLISFSCVLVAQKIMKSRAIILGKKSWLGQKVADLKDYLISNLATKLDRKKERALLKAIARRKRILSCYKKITFTAAFAGFAYSLIGLVVTPVVDTGYEALINFFEPSLLLNISWSVFLGLYGTFSIVILWDDIVLSINIGES